MLLLLSTFEAAVPAFLLVCSDLAIVLLLLKGFKQPAKNRSFQGYETFVQKSLKKDISRQSAAHRQLPVKL